VVLSFLTEVGHECQVPDVSGYVRKRHHVSASQYGSRRDSLSSGIFRCADYAEHCFHAILIVRKGTAYYPLRYDIEFSEGEIELRLQTFWLQRRGSSFLKSRRDPEGIRHVRSAGMVVKDMCASLPNALIAFPYT